jgi:hypothetical protein
MQWMRPVTGPSLGNEPVILSLAFSKRLRMLSQEGPTAIDSLLPRAHGPRTTSWRHMHAQLGVSPRPLQIHLRERSAAGNTRAVCRAMQTDYSAGSQR